MKNDLKKFVLEPIKTILRHIICFGWDTIDLLLGRRDNLTPSCKLRGLYGIYSFKKIGKEFFRYFKDLCALKPSEDVLDVGCGCGRMAIPLTRYLNQNGTYEGFDIVSAEIEWCRENISFQYPNFHFQLADVFNKKYNPKGKYEASQYKFPYEDESFDFVFLTSVFTHMLPLDIENYLSEIARVLKKGGRCLITYFLLNVESLELIDAKLSALDFKYIFEDYRTTDRTTPEAAVVYNEEYIRRLYEKFGLDIVDCIHYGSWCGRKDFLSYQDIIIASRG